MGKILLSLVIASLVLFTQAAPVSAEAGVSDGLKKVCPRITNLGFHQLYKFQASGHLAGTDRANSCSFIGGPGAPEISSNWLPLYDGSGRKLSVFRNYARNGFYHYRFYTYHPTCTQIVKLARKHTKKSIGYVKVSSKYCIKVPNLAGRNGAAY